MTRDKRAMGELGTAGQFQQRPTPRGGGMFPTDRFVLVDHPPEPAAIADSIRYWDKAGTKDGGAFTAGVLLHKLKDGRFCVAHCRRGQWSALEREREIRQIAELDGKRIRIAIEQEPGSGGKESAETHDPQPRRLARHRRPADRREGGARRALRRPGAGRQRAAGQGRLEPGLHRRACLLPGRAAPRTRSTRQPAAFNLLTLRRSRLPVWWPTSTG